MTVRRTRAPRDARVRNMNDDILECREERHLFRRSDETAERWRWPDRDVVVRTTRCAQCRKVVRIKTVDEGTGELAVPTRLVYDKDYLSPSPGTGRIPMAAVRLERTRRWLDSNPLPQRRATP